MKDLDIENTAKHEACHLLLGRLNILGMSRYISKEDIEEADEEVVRILEKLL